MNKPKQLTFPWNTINKSSLEGFYSSEDNLHVVSILNDKTFQDDLFIYGSKESGKTYLLQAMCNSFSSYNKSSLYIPLKKAMNYVSNDENREFWAKSNPNWIAELSELFNVIALNNNLDDDGVIRSEFNKAS